MSSHKQNPPYFDELLSRLKQGDPLISSAFGRHVHWGYWPEPDKASCDASEYDQAAERLTRVICDMADVTDGTRVLDVGCGFGGTLASLNHRRSNLRLVGVNIDARQLERAARVVTPGNGNSVEFLQADAADIPLEDSSFDIVLAVECVFHFDRLRFFSEVSRLLRPGGSLTLSDFVPSERAVEYLDAIDFSKDESVRWSYGEIDLSCSINRYRELATASGLVMMTAADITPMTMPTYEFLYANAARWDNPREIELFTRATRILEKANRNGMISYQLLRFEKPIDAYAALDCSTDN